MTILLKYTGFWLKKDSWPFNLSIFSFFVKKNIFFRIKIFRPEFDQATLAANDSDQHFSLLMKSWVRGKLLKDHQKYLLDQHFSHWKGRLRGKILEDCFCQNWILLKWLSRVFFWEIASQKKHSGKSNLQNCSANPIPEITLWDI